MAAKFFLQWIVFGLIGSILLTARDRSKNKIVALKAMYILLNIAILLYIIVSVVSAPGNKLVFGVFYAILYGILLRVIRNVVAKALRQ